MFAADKEAEIRYKDKIRYRDKILLRYLWWDSPHISVRVWDILADPQYNICLQIFPIWRNG